ncbi:hypothetical protein BANRA_05513 [Klebsiella pneumoniae]|nr:hypothetical protein BANRA_05513 [Klebsiella pneumoniae]
MKVFFHLSYETMLGDTEDFINACLERANRADCNDADAEIARHAARSNSGTTGDGGPCPGRRRRQGPSAPHRNAPARSHSRTTFSSSNNLRRPSPLQRRVLIVLAALDAKRPGPVATRDIERVLEQGGDAPVRTEPARLLPAHGSRGLAAHPARAEPAAGRRADGGRSRRRTALPQNARLKRHDND